MSSMIHKMLQRLVYLAIGFENIKEESTIQGDSVDLITTGINMMGGNVAEALMILTNNFQEHGIALPELLPPTLRRFASHEATCNPRPDSTTFAVPPKPESRVGLGIISPCHTGYCGTLAVRRTLPILRLSRSFREGRTFA